MLKNLFCMLLLCSACQPIVNSRGNLVIPECVDSFVVGETTMDEVIKKCGTPSLHKDNLTWIYLSGRSEVTSFKIVEMKNNLVVRLTFDENKILRNIEKLHPEDVVLLENDEAAPLITEAEAQKLVKSNILSEKQ